MTDPHDNHEDFVIRRDSDEENLDEYGHEAQYDRSSDDLHKKSPLPYIVGGVVVIILIIVLSAMLAGRRGGSEARRLHSLEARIQQLEKGVATIGAIDQALSRLEKQEEKLDALSQRFDRFENTLNTQVDQIIKELGALHQKIDRPAQAGKAAARKGAQTPKSVSTQKEPRYHQVRAGETLYRIARRYGLTVKQLQDYNHIGPQTAIYPGQKLRLTAPAGP